MKKSYLSYLLTFVLALMVGTCPGVLNAFDKQDPADSISPYALITNVVFTAVPGSPNSLATDFFILQGKFTSAVLPDPADANELGIRVGPYAETIPVRPADWQRGINGQVNSYRRFGTTGQGVSLIFLLNFQAGNVLLFARNVDLRGLEAPVDIEISLGSFVARCTLDQQQNIKFLRGVRDHSILDSAFVLPGGVLIARGRIAAASPTTPIDSVTVSFNGDKFDTFPRRNDNAFQALAGNFYIYRGNRVTQPQGKINFALINLDACTFYLQGTDPLLVSGSNLNGFGLELGPYEIGSDNTVTTEEDTAYTFAPVDFNFSAVDMDDQQIQISGLPTVGALKLSGVDVILNQTIAAGEIAHLSFTPLANEYGAVYDSFQFKIHDGIEYSADVYTMTIDVIAVNDAPTAADHTVIIDENTTYTFAPADFNFNDLDVGDILNRIQITRPPTIGALKLRGVNVNQNQIITAGDIVHLTFTPQSYEYGVPYDSFQFKVHDGAAYSTAAYTMTIGVNAAYDVATAIDITQAPYLAARDGVTDDSSKLQQALDDSRGSGRAVLLSQGIFLVNQEILLPDGTALIGDHATLKNGGRDPHSGDEFMVKMGNNCLIRDLTVDGNMKYLGGIQIKGKQNSIIYHGTVQNISTNASGRLAAGIGVGYGFDNIHIEACTIRNIIGGDFGCRGIEVAQSTYFPGRITIRDCEFDTIQGNSRDIDSDAIHIWGQIDPDNVARSCYATIEDCRFSNFAKRAIKIQASNVAVRNNTIVSSDCFTAIYCGWCIGTIIENNEFNLGKTYGAVTIGPKVVDTEIKHNIIEINAPLDAEWVFTDAATGFYLTEADKTIITNNQVRSPRGITLLEWETFGPPTNTLFINNVMVVDTLIWQFPADPDNLNNNILAPNTVTTGF